MDTYYKTKYNTINHLQAYDHRLVDVVGVEFGPKYIPCDLIKLLHIFIVDESVITRMTFIFIRGMLIMELIL